MHKNYSVLAFSAVAALAFSACGGSANEAKAPTMSTRATASAAPTGDPPATFEEQAALGAKLYAENCARCHGDHGQGTDKAPRVVGLDKGAFPLNPPPGAKLRKTQFRTAADIAKFASKNMPADKPGSLPEWQYWDILAFALKANGIELHHKLDAETAKQVVIHKGGE